MSKDISQKINSLVQKAAEANASIKLKEEEKSKVEKALKEYLGIKKPTEKNILKKSKEIEKRLDEIEEEKEELVKEADKILEE